MIHNLELKKLGGSYAIKIPLEIVKAREIKDRSKITIKIFYEEEKDNG